MGKTIKTILICLVLAILILVCFFIIDYNRITKNKESLFCIKKSIYEDGKVKEYLGLGYKIISFDMLNGNNKVEVGNIFLRYDKFTDIIEKYKLEKAMDNVANELNRILNN